jgi:hypothetical protein
MSESTAYEQFLMGHELAILKLLYISNRVEEIIHCK